MSAILEIENLFAGYQDKSILKDVVFQISRGEMVGIIGPNGAGKSTLLKTIRGLLPMQQGNIKLFDVDVKQMSEKEFARKVSYLQQHMDISFGYTAKEIVLTGRYPYLKWWQREGAEDEKIAELCMEYTDVLKFADIPAQQVSGGQRQRILLAKVLAQQTPVLFLDEPTTGLDIVYQEEIFRFCQALCKAGKTVLMVVHELSLAAKFCSRLLLVGNGGILADGTVEEVLTEENLSEAYKVPVQVMRNPLTGGVEICTSYMEKHAAREEALIRMICEQ